MRCKGGRECDVTVRYVFLYRPGGGGDSDEIRYTGSSKETSAWFCDIVLCVVREEENVMLL